MARVVVCGAGVIGLATALLLAADGHEVTVLEQDRAAPPGDGAADAWRDWQRPGVAQFRQPHNLFPRFQQVLDADLPEVGAALRARGCRETSSLRALPPTLSDQEPRPGDERFRFLTGRRPVVEAAFSAVVEEHPGVRLLRGAGATGLLADATAAPGAPVRVRGVRAADGAEHRADLVVDATGRTSPFPRWVQAAGGQVDEQSCDRGFAYYTRYFAGEELPPLLAPSLAPHGSVSVLTIPGDNGTWSVTLFGTSRDRALKAARDPERWTRALRAFPLQAHWLEGEPVTGVLPMAGVLDRTRRYVVDGVPAVVGLVAVGDAWACTNPSAGRGLSVGLLHAQLLRDLLREQPGVDADLALAYDARTEQVVAPFVTGQHLTDRQRIAEMEAERDGTPLPPPLLPVVRLMTAGMRDADLFRALVETVTCLATPAEVLARPGVAETVARLGLDERPPLPGPTRSQLEALLA